MFDLIHDVHSTGIILPQKWNFHTGTEGDLFFVFQLTGLEPGGIWIRAVS